MYATNSEWLKQSGDDTDPEDDAKDGDDSDDGASVGGGRAAAKKRAADARRKKAAAKKSAAAASKKPKVQFWAFGEDSTHHILAIDIETGAVITIDKNDPTAIEMAGNNFAQFIEQLTEKPSNGAEDDDDGEGDEDDLAALYEGGDDDDEDVKSQGSAAGSDADDLLDKLEAQGALNGGGGSGSDTDDEPYGYQCDGCRVEIRGVRFSCDVCDNFDLW